MLDNRKKIIIDTDNGDDIDDLITLYFAFAMLDKFEIIGIVCSFLNAPLRVKQVEYVLKLHGITNVPVFAGERHPIKGIHGHDINTIYCQYFDFLGKARDDDSSEAINFIIESAKKYQDDLYFVEIAPQTTLARAIRKDKNALKKIHIVTMAGCFEPDYAEWNIECDYEASKTVLESGLDLTYIGHDITINTTLNDPIIEQYFLNEYEDERRNFLSMCANSWRNCSKRPIVLHDILALLSIVDKNLVKFEQKSISFKEKDGHYYTLIDSNSNHVANIATSVNLPLLYEYVKWLMRGEQ